MIIEIGAIELIVTAFCSCLLAGMVLRGIADYFGYRVMILKNNVVVADTERIKDPLL